MSARGRSAEAELYGLFAGEARGRALAAWLRRAARDGDEVAACTAAAEALADHPWAVSQVAGGLARARLVRAPRDLGLDGRLRVVAVDAPEATARVPEGAPYPAFDTRGRRRRGAFDTPAELARRTVARALAAADGPVRSGRDPACGPGAFLLALREAGVAERHGVELDPRAAAVARVADPGAQVEVGDGFAPREAVDLVVGNPPFVPPERQGAAMRRALRARFDWLDRRFDLAVPFAAVAREQVRPGGALGLVLPCSLLWEPYARGWRRQLLARDAVVDLEGPLPFPGAAVRVAVLVLRAGGGPAPVAPGGLDAQALLGLDQAPLNPRLRPGDPALVAWIRARSRTLGELCEVDTGVVSHGPDGGKARLLHDRPGAGRVPYVDARDLHRGTRHWLQYAPERMHRAKRPELFEGPKLLVQRLRGKGPVHVWVDESGLYAGHTLTVVRPLEEGVDLEALSELLRSPEVDALLRIERGERLDLYPRDVAGIPVPLAWEAAPGLPLSEAWELAPAARQRLRALASRRA